MEEFLTTASGADVNDACHAHLLLQGWFGFLFWMIENLARPHRVTNVVKTSATHARRLFGDIKKGGPERRW